MPALVDMLILGADCELSGEFGSVPSSNPAPEFPDRAGEQAKAVKTY